MALAASMALAAKLAASMALAAWRQSDGIDNLEENLEAFPWNPLYIHFAF